MYFSKFLKFWQSRVNLQDFVSLVRSLSLYPLDLINVLGQYVCQSFLQHNCNIEKGERGKNSLFSDIRQGVPFNFVRDCCYRHISLMSSIMKLFERVTEQRLPSYLENIGFKNKYQSGFRQNKSTDDRLFRLSQSVMESFNRGEHVVAAFLGVEKAFDNVCTMDSGIKLSCLTFQLKWHVGCLIF